MLTIRKEKSTDGIVQVPEELTNTIFQFCHDELQEIFSITSKKERNMRRDDLLGRIEEAFISQAEDDGKHSSIIVKRAYKVFAPSDSMKDSYVSLEVRIEDSERAIAEEWLTD